MVFIQITTEELLSMSCVLITRLLYSADINDVFTESGPLSVSRKKFTIFTATYVPLYPCVSLFTGLDYWTGLLD